MPGRLAERRRGSQRDQQSRQRKHTGSSEEIRGGAGIKRAAEEASRGEGWRIEEAPRMSKGDETGSGERDEEAHGRRLGRLGAYKEEQWRGVDEAGS